MANVVIIKVITASCAYVYMYSLYRSLWVCLSFLTFCFEWPMSILYVPLQANLISSLVSSMYVWEAIIIMMLCYYWGIVTVLAFELYNDNGRVFGTNRLSNVKHVMSFKLYNVVAFDQPNNNYYMKAPCAWWLRERERERDWQSHVYVTVATSKHWLLPLVHITFSA